MKTAARSAWLLLAGDLAGLAAFVWLGMRTHETLDAGSAAQRFALNAAALMLAWVAAGWLMGAFRAPASGPKAQGGDAAQAVREPLGRFLGRTLLAWLLAAPYGLVLRGLLLGTIVLPLAFLGATIAAGGGLLLGWRLVYWLSRRRRR